MTRTANLVKGIRQLLLGAGLTTVQIGPMADTTDAATAITPYPIDDDMQIGTNLQAVQIHLRGTKTGGVQPVFDNQDSVFDVLGNLANAWINGIHITVCWRQMSTPLTLDNGRPEIRDTYYLRTDRLGRAG